MKLLLSIIRDNVIYGDLNYEEEKNWLNDDYYIRFKFRKQYCKEAREFAISNNSWIVDGEILFSHPEGQRKFYRKASLMRYRYSKEYQSLETAFNNKQFHFRLNNSFLFSLKSKIFMGINLWSESEYKKHGLEDLLLVNLSMSQIITYNPFYKRGFICGYNYYFVP